MVEKGLDVGIAESFGWMLGVCGQFSQEFEDIVRGNGSNISITKLNLKIAKGIAVITNRIFFRIGPVIIKKMMLLYP